MNELRALFKERSWPLSPAPALDRRVFWALTAVIALGSALRLYGLSSTSLWYDETASLYLARFVDWQGSLFDSTKTTEAPMMAILSKLWYNTIVRGLTDFPVASARNDFLVRLLPCMLQILSIPLVFALARRLLADNVAALVAALLFAVSPFQVYYAQEYRIYAWVVCVELCGVWSMLNALEHNRLRDWLGFGLAMATLLYSHYFSVWAVFTCSLFYLSTLPWKFNRIIRWTMINVLVIAAAIPALICAFRMNNLVQQISPPWYPTPTVQMGLTTFKDFFAGYSPTIWAYKGLFLLAASLFVIGLLQLAWRRRWLALSFLLFFTVVPIAGSVFVWSHQRVSFYEHRIFIFSAVAAVIAVAAGVRAVPFRVWTGLTLGALLLLTVPSLRNHYLHRLHPAPVQRQGVFDKVDFRSTVRYIESHAQPGDILAYPTVFCRYSMEHYSAMEQYKVGGDASDAPHYVQWLSNGPLLERHGLLPTPIADVEAKAKRIWLVRAYGITFEDGPFSFHAEERLQANWHVTDEQKIGGLYVRLFERNVAPVAANAKPNVLLVIVDTLRADRVAAQRGGVPVMPEVHKLAEQSEWYTQAWSAATWTKPSVTSILTGLYPLTHHVEFGVQKPWFSGQDMSSVQGLSAGQPTIATSLHDLGYATYGVQSNHHLTQAYGYAQGFDDYQFVFGGVAGLITDRALEAVSKAGEKPWFVYAHYFDPHASYTPPDADRAAFGPLPGLTPEESEWLKDENYHTGYYMDRSKYDVGFIEKREYAEFSEKGKQSIGQLYDGECHYADREIGRLIQQVRKGAPNTIVVFVADHGEEFWEHGSIGHAKTVYQELAHVPLIVSVPGRAAARIEAPVETVDIVPTIAAAVGAPARAEWEGQSLLGEHPADRTVYCETQGSIPEFKIHAQAVMAWPYKLVRDLKRERTRLYDLSADPCERNDLAAGMPDRVDSLLQRWEEHANKATSNAAAAIAPLQVDLQQPQLEQLNAIGYLNGDNKAPSAVWPGNPEVPGFAPLSPCR